MRNHCEGKEECVQRKHTPERQARQLFSHHDPVMPHVRQTALVAYNIYRCQNISLKTCRNLFIICMTWNQSVPTTQNDTQLHKDTVSALSLSMISHCSPEKHCNVCKTSVLQRQLQKRAGGVHRRWVFQETNKRRQLLWRQICLFDLIIVRNHVNLTACELH